MDVGLEACLEETTQIPINLISTPKTLFFPPEILRSTGALPIFLPGNEGGETQDLINPSFPVSLIFTTVESHTVTTEQMSRIELGKDSGLETRRSLSTY